jgi:PAS domain-containing protein
MAVKFAATRDSPSCMGTRPSLKMSSRLPCVLDRRIARSHAMEISKYTSQLFLVSEQVTVYLRQAQNTLTRLGRSVADKPRRLQEALRARENDLRDLLVSSLDPIVVTDVGCRFVAANQKGLDLFGVSETNMRMFNVDAFLSLGQMPYFEGNGSPFLRGIERHGQCTIRRLNGSSRFAEYIFAANFVPHRHLCRFVNVKPVPVKLLTQTFHAGHGSNSSNSFQLY